MSFVSNTSALGENTPERNRFIERMNTKHPDGWSVGQPSFAEGRQPISEEIFAALNHLENLQDADELKHHMSFPDNFEQHDIRRFF